MASNSSSRSSIASAVESAVLRAESRASVLSRLEKNYGNETANRKMSSKDQSTLGPKAEKIEGSRASTDEIVVSVIQSFINDSRERTKRQLSDALIGKSIVLSNVSAQSEAMKSAKRSRR
jgi:hypothetical protein